MDFINFQSDYIQNSEYLMFHLSGCIYTHVYMHGRKYEDKFFKEFKRQIFR